MKKLDTATKATGVRDEPCFSGDSTDYFAEVCEMAGVDSTLIRQRIMRELNESDRSEPREHDLLVSASQISTFAGAPCGSYEPAMMESAADTQTACAN